MSREMQSAWGKAAPPDATARTGEGRRASNAGSSRRHKHRWLSVWDGLPCRLKGLLQVGDQVLRVLDPSWSGFCTGGGGGEG